LNAIFIIICTALITSFAGIAHAEEAELNVTNGEPFTFGVETELEESSYSWTLTRDDQIISAQAGRFFMYTMPDASPTDLSVTITGANGREEMHSFKVTPQPAIEISPSDQSFVRAVLRTEPPASSDQVVTLPLYGGSMLLYMDESTGKIREYHVDTNTDSDSDGDGDSGNDADNRSHPSFYAGESFPVSIVPAPGEVEREIQLTVFGMQGEVSRTNIKVAFSPEVPLVPNLITFPITSSQMGLITIPAKGGVISFDASGSTGGAQRYSLDLNLDVDSDGDGVADNDQDVAGSQFERSGKEIAMFMRSVGGKRERKIVLTVQRGDGQTSSVSRMIRFTGAMPDEGSSTERSGLRIISDADVIRVGEKFTLTIEDVPESATSFEWDLQSDGNVDSETNEPSLLLEPDAPGVLPVRVTIYDQLRSKISTVSSKFTVRSESYDEDSDDDMLDTSLGEKELKIDVTTEGLSVSLKPVAGEGIDIHSFSPTWKFGDGEKSYLLTPSHQYSESGTYEVSLSLFDMASEREIVSAKTEVSVEGVQVVPSDDGEGGALSSILSSIASIFKIFIFVLLFLIVVGGIFAGIAFVFAKQRGVKIQELFRGKKEEERRSPLRQGYGGQGGLEEEKIEEGEEESVAEIIEAASVPSEPEKPAEPPPVKLEAEPEVEVKEEQKEEDPLADIVQPPAAEVKSSVEEKKEEVATPDVVETPPSTSSGQAGASPTEEIATEAPKTEEPPQPPKPQTQESLPPWLQATQGQPEAAPQAPPKKEETPVSAPEPPQTPAPPPPPPEPPRQAEQPVAPTEKKTPEPTPSVSPNEGAQVPNWLEQGMEKAAEEGQTQKTPPPAEISGTTPSDTAAGVTPTPPPQPSPDQKSDDKKKDDETIAIVEAELPESENQTQGNEKKDKN